MADRKQHQEDDGMGDQERKIGLSISGIGDGLSWALIMLAFLIAIFEWDKRLDCAIGIQAACAQISAEYAEDAEGAK